MTDTKNQTIFQDAVLQGTSAFTLTIQHAYGFMNDFVLSHQLTGVLMILIEEVQKINNIILNPCTQIDLSKAYKRHDEIKAINHLLGNVIIILIKYLASANNSSLVTNCSLNTLKADSKTKEQISEENEISTTATASNKEVSHRNKRLHDEISSPACHQQTHSILLLSAFTRIKNGSKIPLPGSNSPSKKKNKREK